MLVNRGNLLLAFSPGTGKTPTALAAAEHLMEEGYVSLCLVICPAALKYQWEERIKEFTDTEVLTIDGDKKKRTEQYTSVWASPLKLDARLNQHYMIISYDYVLTDEEMIPRPDMVILDEASAIKSFRTQRSKKIKKLFRDVPYKLALTATPIENKPDELFSIMQFVDPTVLGRYDLFDKAYITRHKNGWATSYKNLDVLNQRLGEAMIRKTRHDADVKDYMPDVDTQDWTVPMTDDVAKVYSLIAQDMLIELGNIETFREVSLSKYYNGVDESSPPGRLMAMHMCLEMLLCHPALLEWSAANYLSDRPEGSEYAYLLQQSGDIDHLPLSDSPKLAYLREKLTPILANPDSKVLIYSKYKYMLEILRSRLAWDSVLFTGDMSAKEKNAAKNKFAEDADIRLFLSSYAGGYGLDMNMADYLINYDHPWSFGAQDQINSRHVRASSVFDKVYVRNLIVQGSIEERKLRTLARKKRMSELAIDGIDPGPDPFGASVSLDADFLRTHLQSKI